MYIIKNSLKNLLRNKGRNILLAIIVFGVLITTVVSITINLTTGEIIDSYKMRFGNEVMIDFDYENLSKVSADGFKQLTLDNLIHYSKSDLLKSTTLSCSLPTKLLNIKSVPGTMDMSNISGSFGGNGPSDKDFVMPNSTLYGTNRSDISQDFKSGARKLKEGGKVYEKDGECIISEQLATLNNLSVGDMIELRGESSKNTQTKKLIITGIFEDFTMLPENNSFEEYSEIGNRNNDILTSFETVEASGLIDTDLRKDPFTAFYTLKEPSMLDSFKKELTKKGLPSYYRATTDEESYKKIVGPVESMKNITLTFMIVVLVLGSGILIVLSSFMIRERKYEIGVLRAIGMSKLKVALGLVFETLVIASFCLLIGLGAGRAISQPIASSLLSSQIEALKDTSGPETQGSVFQRNDPSAQEPDLLSNVDIKIDLYSIFIIISITLGLTIISSAGGVLYITKLEPVKILSERN